MIENTLLHFKTKAAFNTELEAGNIKDDSITFVLDSKEIITHSESYKGVSWHSAGAVSDGIYAVSAKGELIDYTTADATALGVALVAGEHKFMIAKSDATNDGSNYYLYWTNNTSDLSLTNYSKVDGTNGSGNLPKPDGTFGGSTHLSDDFTTWKAGALSDFNGKANTAVIAAASSHAKDMCTVLNTFNQTEQTAGRSTDWYVPACGQLALMYLNMTEINAALAKIGGTALAAGGYWSSSENSSSYAWYVNFGSGCVDDDYKANRNRVRFIRDIEITTPVNQTFIHYPEKSQFTTQLESGNIPNETIVFIDDTKEIWTHGTYYGCSELDLSNIATKEELASKLDVNTADSNYWKRTETVNQAVSSEFASSAYADDKDNRISTTYATKTEVTTGLNGKINLNGTVTSVIAMSQSEYDALATKDPRTLYIITES